MAPGQTWRRAKLSYDPPHSEPLVVRLCMFCLTLIERNIYIHGRTMPIHVAITRKVKPGCERAFEESLRELFKDSLAREGVLGVHLISPPQGSNTREYGVLRTFTTEHERDQFYRSDRFGQWQKQVATLTEGERTYGELHGLEAWFHSADSPQRWKMAF